MARYTVEGGSFELASGENVLEFEDLPDRGPIRSFSWDSESVVAVLTTRFGPTQEQFEGGFEGEVSPPDGGPPIREVTVCAPRGGRAVLCELDMGDATNVYNTAFGLDGDPEFEDDENEDEDAREGVVHVTSDETTADYAHSMVNVLARTDERVHLSELDSVSYDYYEGGDNTGTVPDEAFVTLLTPNDQLKLAVTTVSRSVDEESWEDLNVLDLMEEGRWHVVDIGFTDLSTSVASITIARALRDDPDQGNIDLIDEYGNGTLAGVGFGAGNTGNGTDIDRYFDDLTVDWDPDDDSDADPPVTYDFPAVLPFSVEEATRRGNGNGPLTATLSPEDELGVSLDDVVSESVKLNDFGPFAAPPEPGAPAQEVTVEDGSLKVQVRPPAVDEVLDNGSHFIISGDLDVPTGTSFFAVGQLE